MHGVRWGCFYFFSPRSADIDETTEVIPDYVNFCTDNMVTEKQVTVYPNNKLYNTKEIKHCINRGQKKFAFKNHDRVALKSVQKELNRLL